MAYSVAREFFFTRHAVVPLLPQRHRRAGVVTIVAVAVFASALRIAFGGHYLSDVVLGALSTLIVFAALTTLVEAVARQATAPRS